MRRFFRKETKSESQLRSDIDDLEEANRAYRLSLELRALADKLQLKAAQLEKELAHGRNA